VFAFKRARVKMASRIVLLAVQNDDYLNEVKDEGRKYQSINQSINQSIYCYMAARRMDYTVRQLKKHHSHCKLFKEQQQQQQRPFNGL